MPPAPLRQAHAHNDYRHPRPLLDALDRGFASVEADIHLVDGALLVAHDRAEAKPGRTLQSLYLDPLRERAKANGGRVVAGDRPFFLLVDVKSAATATYTVLDKVLAGYSELLSVTRGGKFTPGAVTVVVSGARDRAAMARQEVRYAGEDGRPEDLDSDIPAERMPWVSGNWLPVGRWGGTGPMPAGLGEKLREMAGKAHARGRLLRFWATPEREAVWAELLAAGVDLIGTDDLDRLKAFLAGR